MKLGRLLREPLVHFLAVGGILFGVFGLTRPAGPESPVDGRIVVDKASLLTFMQYRSKAFQPEYFSAQLDAMSAEEQKSLVDQYVQEESLYREAKAMGLEQGDYVIRQRLVQKMRFLIEDLAGSRAEPSEAELGDYFQRNKERYRIDPSVTFAHVFFDSSTRGAKAAQELAGRLKGELNAKGAGFSDAPQFGDRFPFMQNYVERTFDYVASQFGIEFVSALKSIDPSEKLWRGPLRSTYGYHLVLMTQRVEARLPEIDEIRSQVKEDLLRDQLEDARAGAISRLAGRYAIETKDLGGRKPK